ncbi:MAG: metal ABC transporter substrate-binding protein [Aquificaceae bacterium]
MALFLLLFLLTLSVTNAKELLIASTYPIYYPLSYIAGEGFRVDLLVKTQADPHHYEPKPSDLRKLQSARAFLSLGVETWEMGIVKRLPKEKSYSLAKGINLIRVGNNADPHIWMSPKAYAKLVENIRDVLIGLDSSNADYYRGRYEEFMKSLRALDEEYGKVLSSCESRTIIITHLSLLYLGRDYRLEMVGLRGVHAEEEPRPSEIRRIVDKARETKARYLFYEIGQDEKLVKAIAKEVGAKIVPINTSLFPEKGGDDYFSIMRRNLNRLAEGLVCPRR